MEETLEALSKRGVTIVAVAGDVCSNTRHSSTEDLVPQCFAGPETDIIFAGASDNQGRLHWESVPGTAECPVDLYAPGFGIEAYRLTDQTNDSREGPEYSAALVAGVAATFLAHPDYQEKFEYSPTDADDNTGGHAHEEVAQGAGVSTRAGRQEAGGGSPWGLRGRDPCLG
ncbi:hypothetical protein B0T22DRAFT_241901 [Podospora appendiculata]|uniref:Subtilisin n=1 Tax=Podospora appendiculata TaxID=314037 RepID=A0AAE1CB34_9PEZI|nr:hypothetical protein B0T22DRAFT_241901 [Podospora appendiculata]